MPSSIATATTVTRRPASGSLRPANVLRTIDELAEAIATAIAPYEPISIPAAAVKTWLKR
jgi:hypothetical protein